MKIHKFLWSNHKWAYINVSFLHFSIKIGSKSLKKCRWHFQFCLTLVVSRYKMKTRFRFSKKEWILKLVSIHGWQSFEEYKFKMIWYFFFKAKRGYINQIKFEGRKKPSLQSKFELVAIEWASKLLDRLTKPKDKKIKKDHKSKQDAKRNQITKMLINSNTSRGNPSQYYSPPSELSRHLDFIKYCKCFLTRWMRYCGIKKNYGLQKISLVIEFCWIFFFLNYA